MALQRFLSHGRKEESFTKGEEEKKGGRKDGSSVQPVMICTHSICSCCFINHKLRRVCLGQCFVEKNFKEQPEVEGL